MRGRLNTDRAADAWRFRVWVEWSDGAEDPLPRQFGTFDGAVSAGDEVIRADGAYRIRRVWVYDDREWPTHELERRA